MSDDEVLDRLEELAHRMGAKLVDGNVKAACMMWATETETAHEAFSVLFGFAAATAQTMADPDRDGPITIDIERGDGGDPGCPPDHVSDVAAFVAAAGNGDGDGAQRVFVDAMGRGTGALGRMALAILAMSGHVIPREGA